MIRIELSQEKVRNGDSLTGRVVWTASGKKQPRKIEAICRWPIVSYSAQGLMHLYRLQKPAGTMP